MMLSVYKSNTENTLAALLIGLGLNHSGKLVRLIST